jgi:hypothetical protein
MLMQLQQLIGTIRLGESFDYAQEIARPFGQIDRVIEWCKTELTGDWRWQVVTSSSDRAPGRYIFYFDSDRDAAAFSLFWS